MRKLSYGQTVITKTPEQNNHKRQLKHDFWQGCAAHADQILLNEMSDAYSEALNMLHSFKGGYWRDKEQTMLSCTTLRYSEKGEVAKEPTACEFELVCSNLLTVCVRLQSEQPHRR